MLGRWLIVAGTAVLVVGFLAGCSQMNKGDVAASGDHAFMRQAAHDGAAEVEMGRLAVQKAANPDVKAFGQRMVTDHTAANNQLLQLGRTKNVDLPTAPTSAQRLDMDMLKGKNGADFDRAYMSRMVKDHEADVKAFQNEANTGKDPEVVAFARQTLPTLQDHLGQAREVAARVGAK